MKIKITFLAVSLMLSVTSLFAQNTFTFTNCGATGQYGPSQANADSEYNGTSLDGYVFVDSNVVQKWVVPFTGPYHIEVSGAEGGNSGSTGFVGGKGAKMIGDFNLIYGDTIRIVVGQAGGGVSSGGGGGGGSFVVTSSNTPLIIAAGGGGAGKHSDGGSGLITLNGGDSDQPLGTFGATAPGVGGGAPSLGGSDGYGGGGGAAGGGGGFFDDGGFATSGFVASKPGLGFLNESDGGNGNDPNSFGGFGGGGGGSLSNGYGGGAGGYSGGGAGNWSSPTAGNGGGGGSYNDGTNKVDSAGINAGHGLVIFTRLNVGVFENDFESRISIYPNPTNGVINLELEGALNVQEITISDLQGKVVYQEINSSGITTRIDLSDMDNGIYLLQIRSKDGLKSHKIIKQE